MFLNKISFILRKIQKEFNKILSIKYDELQNQTVQTMLVPEKMYILLITQQLVSLTNYGKIKLNYKFSIESFMLCLNSNLLPSIKHKLI